MINNNHEDFNRQRLEADGVAINQLFTRIMALENNVSILLETAKQDEKRIVLLGARVAALEAGA